MGDQVKNEDTRPARIWAYLHGEMEKAERADFEEALRKDSELMAMKQQFEATAPGTPGLSPCGRAHGRGAGGADPAGFRALRVGFRGDGA